MRRHKCPACNAIGIEIRVKLLVYKCIYCAFTCAPGTASADALAVVNVGFVYPRRANLLLTDYAFAWHYERARELGYIRGGTQARGIYRYYDMLSQLTYYDARPEHMQHTDQWSTGLEMPRQRTSKLLPNTLPRLASLARAHGIHAFVQQRFVREGKRSRVTTAPALPSDVPLASALLEAIGLRWLTPTGDGLLPVPTGTFATAKYRPPRDSGSAGMRW